VKKCGQWKNVVQKCLKARFIPLLLFYTTFCSSFDKQVIFFSFPKKIPFIDPPLKQASIPPPTADELIQMEKLKKLSKESNM